MIDYRCPRCRKKFFEAEGPLDVRVVTVCKRCDGARVTPIADAGPVFQRTCRCEDCGRTQIIDCPVDESMVCMVCGTRTLVVVDEVRPPLATKDEQAREYTSQPQRTTRR